MLSIVTTADGSKTIFNSEVGENYHSKNGALQESKHVFIDAGLLHFLDLYNNPSQTSTAPVSVLEVGFGTGLNFLLSAEQCIAGNIRLDYTGIEAYPLRQEMITETGYDQYIPEELWTDFIKKYQVALSSTTAINVNVDLRVVPLKLADFSADKLYDVIYFDAFASANQPEMWDEAAIAHTINFLKPGGIFVTYAITGNLKRTLKALGCTIEKIPGAAGKREMLRAMKAITGLD